MIDLQGRVALVTGGGRDVGAAISKALAAAGAAVAVNYHGSKAEAEAVAAEIQKAGGKAKAYQADISDAGVVKQLVANVQNDFGGLDILVNNAGLVFRKRFSESGPEDWRKQIDTCLYGALNCCHSAGAAAREPPAVGASSRSWETLRASANPDWRWPRRRAPAPSR